MNIAKIETILTRLNYCIENKKPFSLIRFGDGGLKLIHAFLNNKEEQIELIVRREGLPKNKIHEILRLWGYYARQADYIDSPIVYESGEFWPRIKKPGRCITEKTQRKLKMWKGLYEFAGIDNRNYCNPESNYLMILDDRLNLLDILKNRNTAIICCPSYDIQFLMRSGGYNFTGFQIVKHFENHYKNSFDKTINVINKFATKFDLWLVAGGELGRLYTGLIKDLGGRAVDIGFVADYWVGVDINRRFIPFLTNSDKNNLLLKLHDEGLKYGQYI